MSRKVAVRQPPIAPTAPDAGLSTSDRAWQTPADLVNAWHTAPEGLKTSPIAGTKVDKIARSRHYLGRGYGISRNRVPL